MTDMFYHGSADIQGYYRFSLKRVWNDRKPNICFIMLNPSTANADIDDPTIQSCVRISQCNGFGSLTVVNLFAFISPDPKILLPHPNAVGNPRNDRAIREAVEQSNYRIVCAWGNFPMARDRGIELLMGMLRGKHLSCLGINKNGSPRHPLYAKSDTPLMEYNFESYVMGKVVSND
jgi:hypothetical protein